MQNTEMTAMYRWGKLVLIALFIFLVVLVMQGLKSLREVSPAYNSVTVTGTGEATAVPDIASFSFAVSADAASASDAQAAVTKKMDAILSALTGLGIDKKDIKTSDYSLWPKYKYESTICTMQYPNNCPPTKQVPDGFTASHSVMVKVRDTNLTGKAVAAVGEEGATNISSISFTLDDPDQLINEARTKAITDAREQANKLASALGVDLVRVVSFTDGTSNGPMPYGRETFAADAASAPKAPTLPAGENKVSLTVSVTYEIR